MTLRNYLSACGWIGMLGVLGAYSLLTYGYVDASDPLYLTTNLLASVSLALNCIYKRAWALLVLQFAWAGITIAGFLR